MLEGLGRNSCGLSRLCVGGGQFSSARGDIPC